MVMKMVKMLKKVGFGILLLFLAVSGAWGQGYETYENFGITFEYPSLWSVTGTGSYSEGNVTLSSNDALLEMAWSENFAVFDPQVLLGMEVDMFQFELGQSVPVVDRSGVVDGNPAYAKVLSLDMQEVQDTCMFVDFISSKSNRFVNIAFITPTYASQNIANFEHILNTWEDLGQGLASSPLSPGEDILGGWAGNTGDAVPATIKTLDSILVDWDGLERDSTISDVTIQNEAITFILTAQRNFLWVAPMFIAEFYDKDDIMIYSTIVTIDQPLKFEWRAGYKSHGSITLPESGLEDVEYIKIKVLLYGV